MKSNMGDLRPGRFKLWDPFVDLEEISNRLLRAS